MYYKKLVAKDIYLSPMDLKKDYLITTKWMNEDYEIAVNNGFLADSLNEEKVLQKLEMWNQSDSAFSIVLKTTDELIGNISYFNQSKPVLGATMGIYIAEKYRNLGYGFQAINLMLNHAFNTLNYVAVRIEVFGYNTNAIKTYEKIGFKKVGAWRNAKFHNGKLYDIILMDILKEEFIK